MSDGNAEFDVIVWGATGFTGRLVAAHLLEHHGAGGTLRWAIGGRNREKLEAVAAELARETGQPTEALPRIVADADDARSLDAFVRRTRVVCTTVGPYARVGSKLVAACAEAGTDYCDLTGETQWIRRMIDAHESTARESGARIVHTCGFDSIPSDLGVWFMQREARSAFGAPSPHVKGRVADFKGSFSGGTAASMLNLVEEASADPSVRRLLADPYGLNPQDLRHGPDLADATVPIFDRDFDQWTAPFVMAAINTRVVRRSNALQGFAYGEAFRYDESVLTGQGASGWLKASGLSLGQGAVMLASAVGPLRALRGRAQPAPGEGPSKEERESGFFEIRFHAQAPDSAGAGHAALHGRVTGDRDPGYGSTSKMLGQAALCLAHDELDVGGGFWTPASAMGGALLSRLEKNAGLSFEIVSV
jgi:short subunit dehydrogenase-like uncharacterized protein